MGTQKGAHFSWTLDYSLTPFRIITLNTVSVSTYHKAYEVCKSPISSNKACIGNLMELLCPR
jgi:hypothetical protein